MANSFPILTIPWHMQNIVLENMDSSSRFSMRRCSKRMRQIVNECEPYHYMTIEMYLSRNEVKMTLYAFNYPMEVVYYRRESGEDYIQRSAIDFAGIVARATVHYFRVRSSFRAYPEEEMQTDGRILIQCIAEQMNVLGEQMKVNHLQSKIEVTQDEIMTLLSVIKPVILEKMELYLWREENLDRVTTTEQWNRARKVDLVNNRSELPLFPIDNPPEVPIEKLLHFRKVTIRCRWLTIEEAEKIVEAAIRQGDEFISFRINQCFTTSITRDLIRQLINRQNPDCQLKFRIDPMEFSVENNKLETEPIDEFDD